MKVLPSEIPEVLIIEPRVFGDERGFFYESYNQQAFCENTGVEVEFVQDNHSMSRRHVLRGLHYQIKQTQGKLVRVSAGSIFDVAVDIRKSSPTFGQWAGCVLSEENHRQFWVPAGFAHGFYVLSERAEVLYKATDYYAPQHERTILWNDPDLGIDWQLTETPILSEKDRAGVLLKEAEVFV